MSYQSAESSIASGRPIRLYHFERQGVWSRSYTNADRNIVHQSVSYSAIAIDDDGIRLTGEASADQIKITGPADCGPAPLFRGAPPSDDVWLTVRDYHYAEPDLPESSLVVWVGTVSTVRWPQIDRCEILCDSLSASMRVTGLRLTYERTCPHTIYDTSCGVDRHLHRRPSRVSAVDGASIVCGASEPVFAGGFVEWTISGGLIERRGIVAQDGNKLTLLGGAAGIAAGQDVMLYPGCDQSIECCRARFNNTDNNGGFRHLPGKSPFDGTPVF